MRQKEEEVVDRTGPWRERGSECRHPHGSEVKEREAIWQLPRGRQWVSKERAGVWWEPKGKASRERPWNN